MADPEGSAGEHSASLRLAERIAGGLRDGVAVTDAEGRILFANGILLGMFGYAAEEILGKPVSALEAVPSPLDPSVSGAAAISEVGAASGFSAGVRRDGTTFPVMTTIIPLGEPDGFVVIFRARDERMEVLEDLRAVLVQANSARQTRRNILNSITHEFRTPLTAIAGFADLLDNLAGLPPAGHAYTRAIRASSQRLTTLVESLLEYSQTQSGHAIIRTAPYAVRERIALFAAPYERRFRDRGLDWALRIGADVPPTIEVDGERLERILGLLLDNADKFTETGRVELSVGLSASVAEFVEFAVCDSGIGYDPAFAEKIFEPFRQVEEGLSRRYTGVGLGLALARNLADLIGGTVLASSQPGRGSVFTLAVSGRQPDTSPASRTR